MFKPMLIGSTLLGVLGTPLLQAEQAAAPQFQPTQPGTQQNTSSTQSYLRGSRNVEPSSGSPRYQKHLPPPKPPQRRPLAR